MKLKSLLMQTRISTKRLIFLAAAVFAMSLIPFRVLLRRHPFRNYVFFVGFQWFKVITALLTACGSHITVNTDIDDE